MTVESENAREEIGEIIQDCIKCGLCKSNFPSFDVLKQEQFCPRGMITLFNSNYFERFAYDCLLDKACEHICPVEIKFDNAVIKARKILVENKKEIPEARTAINNMNKTGNIFGVKE